MDVMETMAMVNSLRGNTVDSVGDDNLTASIIDKSITEIVDDTVTTVGDYAFYNCKALTKAEFSAAKDVGTYAFNNCVQLVTVNAPAVTSIGSYAFKGCNELVTADFPVATSIGNDAFSAAYVTAKPKLATANFPVLTSIPPRAFWYCTNLATVNIPLTKNVSTNAFSSCKSLETLSFAALTSINDNAFNGSSLNALLLRNTETVCTLGGTGAFTSTPIASGTGYIYVPRALLSDTDSTKDYRQATNWSTYAAQFRALEDYTVDGTTTGELDSTKI